jgi:hypothetical protein
MVIDVRADIQHERIVREHFGGEAAVEMVNEVDRRAAAL